MKSCSKLLKCEKCDKTYMSGKSLRGHSMAQHTNIFQCEFCEKRFQNNSKLERHKATHVKLTSHTCDVCGKPFSRRDNMIQHKKKKH